MTNHSHHRTTKTLTAAVALILLLTGCERHTDPQEAAPAWNPCTVFPESATQSVGLDRQSPAGADGVYCAWSGTNGYIVGIWYLTAKKGAIWKDGAEDPTPITVGPYSGHTYFVAGEHHNYLCVVQLATRDASVTFEAKNSLLKDEDPCTVARRVANGLSSYLPPAP